MRLFGSNISIFSNRSNASGNMLGNLAENFCFRYCGSCLMYLLALSLRRNSRLASSGEPNNFCTKGKHNVWIMLGLNIYILLQIDHFFYSCNFPFDDPKSSSFPFWSLSTSVTKKCVLIPSSIVELAFL